MEPEIFVKTNVLGTAVLLNAARKAWEREDGTYPRDKRFLHVSTDEVYGSLGETGYFYETTPYAPHSPYSASKASADMLVRSYMDTYGFPANITNCSNNYGPRQFPEKYLEIVNTILEVLQETLEENDPRKAFINDGLIEYVEDRKGHDRRYAINADKIRRETGWTPETSFEDGIRETVRWYVEWERYF